PPAYARSGVGIRTSAVSTPLIAAPLRLATAGSRRSRLPLLDDRHLLESASVLGEPPRRDPRGLAAANPDDQVRVPRPRVLHVVRRRLRRRVRVRMVEADDVQSPRPGVRLRRE